jgi:hypothetical protein
MPVDPLFDGTENGIVISPLGRRLASFCEQARRDLRINAGRESFGPAGEEQRRVTEISGGDEATLSRADSCGVDVLVRGHVTRVARRPPAENYAQALDA